jgi:hypothetical protein
MRGHERRVEVDDQRPRRAGTAFLEHRIADKRVLRLIQKWLGAGVIEDGEWSDPQDGTAQGLRFRRCSQTSTCTTGLTCGPTGGGGSTRAGM